MVEILIETNGYSYHEWVEPVYPEGTGYPLERWTKSPVCDKLKERDS